MKDIKTFVIGFLTCACLFLIMGQTDNKNVMEEMKTLMTQNGRYQATSINVSEFMYIYTTVILSMYCALNSKGIQKLCLRQCHVDVQ